ncbi:MAG: Fis family transcriptional regulator [Gammaproteobacteria bacterium]|nr:Fis family transcriptional regulator [Gammaproteobacteria bacterium]
MRVNHTPLFKQVNDAIEVYFEDLDGEEVTNLYSMVIDEVEKGLLQAVLQRSNSNQSEAARILGISRTTLRKKMETYDIK